MRAWALLLLLAGCHAAAPAPAQPALLLRLSFAPLSGPAGTVTVTTAVLHLSQLVVVSDRATVDARTQLAAIDLAIGDELSEPLAQAPPGLYSMVNTELDNSDHIGIDVEGLYAGAPLHAMLDGGPFDVACATPVRLDPGMHAQLDLSVDMSGWFDGIDLKQALGDGDDNGLVISEDDNQPLATQLLQRVTQSFRLTCAP
jgi:hypothetical protein